MWYGLRKVANPVPFGREARDSKWKLRKSKCCRRARLECTENNLRDLAKVAEYEHGAAQKVLRDGREFYSYVGNQARGFGQEETQAARDHVDRELRRYRQADAVRQQQQFSDLQRNLGVASESAVEQNRRTLNERYKEELKYELCSVNRELDVLRESHTSDDTTRELRDELLVEEQNRWLRGRHFEEELAQAQDRTSHYEQHSFQIEERLAQLHLLLSTSLSELQQQLMDMDSLNTPRMKIDTPDFGAISMSLNASSAPMSSFASPERNSLQNL
eukprot:2969067-Amphidinium_carterae.1